MKENAMYFSRYGGDIFHIIKGKSSTEITKGAENQQFERGRLLLQSVLREPPIKVSRHLGVLY
jgi:hypothetical protein